MIVTSCRLHLDARRAGEFPRDGLAEIAFMGRSNVGKSSLINRLLGVRGLSRTSKTPGRTRSIQFYRVNERLYFVDLPGYGFARVPRQMRQEWKDLVEAYLDRTGRPDLAIHLVDGRHEPTDLDQELALWLRSRGARRQVVLTKADKIASAAKKGAVSEATRRLGLGPEAPPILVSAVTGDGIASLWRVIDAASVIDTHRAVTRHEPGRAAETS